MKKIIFGTTIGLGTSLLTAAVISLALGLTNFQSGIIAFVFAYGGIGLGFTIGYILENIRRH